MIERINDKSRMATIVTTFILTHLSSSNHQTEKNNVKCTTNAMFLTIWSVAGRCSIAIAQQGVVTEQESISEEAVRLLYNSTRFRKSKNYSLIKAN